MNDPTPGAPAAIDVRRRQFMLLGGIVSFILGCVLLAVLVTQPRPDDAPAIKPRPSAILAPGAQVDARDAWRGQADAQLKSIEERSREISQRGTELETQSRGLQERIKKLEQGTLTPLPPPPVSVPPLRPEWGPDRLPVDTVPGKTLPPPPRPANLPPAGSPGPATPAAPASPAGIMSIAITEPPAGKAGKPGDAPRTGNATSAATRDTRRYLPSGSFARALLLGGLDAPTGGQAQRNPQPVLLRLTDHAQLPSHFRAGVRECFVVGAGYGDVSSERAYIRTESLSCVTRDGTAIDIPLKGYVAGEDGKAGMRGRLVSKQGQILANALIAGIASGIGHAFQQGSSTIAISPLGTTSTVDHGKQLEAGLGSGVGKALDRLAQYYISLAEKVFPVIEIDAGRHVDVVLTSGAVLNTAIDGGNLDLDAYPQLAHRARQLNRKDNDEDLD